MIGLAVWRLDREAMYPWRCARCDEHGPRPHPIDPDDPDAERDGERVYVPGYRVVPNARGALEDARVEECPEHALATWCADLAQLWRLADGDVGVAAQVAGAELSAPFIDAWDHFRAHIGELREVLRARREH
ncbi:MAG: hypothetical protein H6705_16765 [Myxococcales bacterium]|nr:hypothetical protein [Myxococcales bacterium]